MFGLGVGVVKEAGDDWAGQRVSGVGLTGLVGGQGTDGLTVDKGRRFRIQQWG